MKRIPKRRDPNWPLPDSPSSPVYREVLARAAEGDRDLFAEFALNDFYFDVRYVLTLGQIVCKDRHLKEWFGRPWFDHPYLFALCRDMQENPYGFLRLHPRFHFKTAVLTQSHAVWEAKDDENLTQMIVTYKIEKVGKTFLSQIKRECEINPLLHQVAPWTFWENPERESSLWTKEAILFRKSDNSQESSVWIVSLEAGATSQHPHIRRFDDLVTEESVASNDRIQSTTEAWRDMAGTSGDELLDSYTGTHWAANDTYRVMLDEGIVQLNRQDVYGPDGVTPQLRSREWVEAMRRIMGPYRFAAQMRNLPSAAGLQTFKSDWLTYDDLEPQERAKRCNVYLFAETAKDGKDSDYHVIWVLGYGPGVPHGHWYVLDLVRDRMGLVRFGEVFFEKVLQWKPLYSFLEQVGAMRDGEYLRQQMNEKGVVFRLAEISERTKKELRIAALQPLFDQKRITMPRSIMGRTDGMLANMIEVFKQQEYLLWTPSAGATHDDMLDCLAWIASPECRRYFQVPERIASSVNEPYKTARRRRAKSNDMAWAV